MLLWQRLGRDLAKAWPRFSGGGFAKVWAGLGLQRFGNVFFVVRQLCAFLIGKVVAKAGICLPKVLLWTGRDMVKVW